MAAEGGGDAALQVLVQNLIDLLKNEISLIRGLKRDAQKLTMKLDTTQKFLNEADKNTIPSEAVKSWLQRLENAAFEAENVLDEFNYHSLSKTLNTNINKQKVPTCCSLFIDCPQKRKMAVSIKKINKDLNSIKKDTWLGLDNILFNATVAGTDTDSFYIDPIFIGRDEVVSEIVETLSVTTDHECVFSVLPIVGMGGLGKTTLTRHVFNHQNIKTQFRPRIWVHVSQVFDLDSLFNKILNELTSSQSREGESKKQNLSHELEEALKNKTYLLVLDNAWNEDILKWTKFFNFLSGVTNTKGNGIIVTTRNTEVASIVASIVGTLPIHQLKFLSKEDCWSIIRAKTFGCVPSGINESVGREIAEICGGLPLAASVIGGVLRHKKSADKWHSIKQNWLSEGEVAHNITKVLELSINNLSSRSLKKCFAYCSIFPKGEQMVKEVLIEMWMAEGFLQPDGGDDMESMGDKFYNVLLDSSLLQVAKREADEHYVERCVMHELMHDVASSVTADVVTRVRYQLIQQHHSTSPIGEEGPEHLRTLIFRADQLSDDTIFSDFKSLHVLTLEVNSLKQLPKSIKELIHLRSLNISETSIGVLPDWIGVLLHLQTLRAERLEKLPSTIKYLINLRHLHIPILEELPAEIGRLTFLQTLPADFIVRDTNGYKIEELRSLNDLKGSLKVTCLEKVRNKEEAEKANLSKKSKLSVLRLEWSSSREEVERNDEKVLEGLQPHSNLKKLFIQGFDGKIFPEWTLKMEVRNVPQGSWVGLNQLMEITFFNCKECEEIPVLGHLPNLKSLYFCNLRNVKSINSSFYGVGNETGIVFPVLETLVLSDMDSLKEWAEVETSSTSEGKVFPHLQSLKISNCNQLMKAPTDHFSSLSQLELNNFGMKELPEWSDQVISHTNSRFFKLKLSDCKRLMRLRSTPAMRLLIEEQRVDIICCPELHFEQQQKCDDDSD